MIHPDDDTLIIVNRKPIEPEAAWINRLISTVTVSAAYFVASVAIILAIAFTVRIAVGNFTFRTEAAYLFEVMAYLLVVIATMCYYAFTMKLPEYKTRWEIEREANKEDPYDEVPFEKFGR